MDCPSCGRPMDTLSLDGHNGIAVEIDLCGGCQAFWFDQHESLQLSPGSTLKLFGIIGGHATAPKPRMGDLLRCPRCRARLEAVQDMQRSTPFRYWRCDSGHGRFISFFEFLREKDFIRQLTPAQVQELRQNIQSVNCSNCGAPIDLARGSVCSHCGSPVAMLDMSHAGQLVDQLRRAAEPRPIDPGLALDLELARRQVDASFAAMGADEKWMAQVSAFGLVEAGLNAVAGWFKKSNG